MNPLDNLFCISLAQTKYFTDENDIHLWIARTLPKYRFPVPYKHIAALAPTQALIFGWWKKLPRTLQTIDSWPEYKRRWDEEKKDDEQYWKMIRLIAKRLKGGKRVIIACYCNDMVICHRWLVEEDVEKELKKGW